MSPDDKKALIEQMLHNLRKAGVSPEDIQQMLASNLGVSSSNVTFENLNTSHPTSSGVEQTNKFVPQKQHRLPAPRQVITGKTADKRGRLSEKQARELQDLRFAYEGIQFFCDQFNETFKGRIAVSNPTHQAVLDSDVRVQLLSAAESLKRDGSGKLLGILYPNTSVGLINSLNYIVSDIVRLLSEEKILESLAGIMQGGKTSCFGSHFLLLPVVTHVLTKGKVKPICLLNVPPFHSMKSNTLHELQASFNLCGSLIFQSGDFICSVSDYWDAALASTAFKKGCFSELVVLRTKTGLAVRDQIRHLRENDGFNAVWVYTDESHWGSARDGIQHKLVQEYKEFRKSFPINEVAISATADEIWSEEVKPNWHETKLPISTDYCGPGYINGEKIPTIGCDGPAGIPDVQNVDAYLSSILPSGFHQVLMRENSYFSLDDFKKKIRRLRRSSPEWDDDDRWEKEWKSFQKSFISQLAYLIQRRLVWDKRKREFFIRLKENQRCRAIQTALQPLLDKILDREYEYVEFYNGEKRPVKEACNVVTKQQKYVIMFATANARVSCPFNPECQTFFDLTEECSTADSLLQGTFGRACGYGKIIDGEAPLVLFRPTVKEQFDILALNNFKIGAIGTPGIRTHTDRGRAPKRKAGVWNVRLSIHNHPNEEVRWRSDSFCALWQHCKKPLLSQPNDMNSLLLNAGFKEIFKDLVTLSKYLPQTQQHFKILDWGQDDQSPQYGKKEPSPTCKVCKKMEKTCQGHPAFRMDVKTPGAENGIEVGLSLSISSPPAYAQLLRLDIDNVARRPGAGNLARNLKNRALTGLRNSSAWREDKREDGGAVPPTAILRFKDTSCPECGTQNIENRLWQHRLEIFVKSGNKKLTGHWPTEITETCCFKHSEIVLEAIIVRLAEVGKPNPVVVVTESLDDKIAIHAEEESRYFEDLDNENDSIDTEEDYEESLE